jgi:hypothetical protein
VRDGSSLKKHGSRLRREALGSCTWSKWPRVRSRALSEETRGSRVCNTWAGSSRTGSCAWGWILCGSGVQIGARIGLLSLVESRIGLGLADLAWAEFQLNFSKI